MKRTNIVSTAMGIIAYLLGVAYACTLILIPVAIYCFIGAKVFMDAASLTPSQLTMKKKTILAYSIFFSIFGFPIGLISLIVYHDAASHDIDISDVGAAEGVKVEQAPETVTERRETSQNTLSAQETLEKLDHLYAEGLITKEELERAKQEVQKQD